MFEPNFANSEFWKTLCGTVAANSLGLDLSLVEDQNKFDDWYMSFYPYLFDLLDEIDVSGKSVVEVGLGLGTVTRQVARSADSYLGIDISKPSVEFVQGTLRQRKLGGEILQASILNLPENISREFDVGIAIGSLHHTGDLVRAIQELQNIVKPSGKILLMIYNEFDFRRWIRRPIRTLGHLMNSYFKKDYSWNEENGVMRALNDADLDGNPAPYTVFSTKRFFLQFENAGFKYKVIRKNFHDYSFISRVFRRSNLLGLPASIMGCDLYAIGSFGENDNLN
jgi:SAM-dependent methyltransferase